MDTSHAAYPLLAAALAALDAIHAKFLVGTAFGFIVPDAALQMTYI